MKRKMSADYVAWAMRKYKRFKDRKTKAKIFLEEISRKEPQLFAHWKIGMIGAFA